MDGKKKVRFQTKTDTCGHGLSPLLILIYTKIQLQIAHAEFAAKRYTRMLKGPPLSLGRDFSGRKKVPAIVLPSSNKV